MGIVLLLFVVINAVLLVTGTVAPVKVEMVNPSFGNDVFAGILLQIGLFGVLTGIAYVFAKIGLSIIKD